MATQALTDSMSGCRLGHQALQVCHSQFSEVTAVSTSCCTYTGSQVASYLLVPACLVSLPLKQPLQQLVQPIRDRSVSSVHVSMVAQV